MAPDVFSRPVVGWKLGSTLEASLVTVDAVFSAGVALEQLWGYER